MRLTQERKLRLISRISALKGLV